jgi:hypothetical protein
LRGSLVTTTMPAAMPSTHSRLRLGNDPPCSPLTSCQTLALTAWLSTIQKFMSTTALSLQPPPLPPQPSLADYTSVN